MNGRKVKKIRKKSREVLKKMVPDGKNTVKLHILYKDGNGTARQVASTVYRRMKKEYTAGRLAL